MALAAAIMTPYGVNATYHAVSHMQIDRLQKIAAITVAGFADKAARDMGCQPLVTLSEPVMYKYGDVRGEVPSMDSEIPTLTEVYEFIKASAAVAPANSPLYALRDATDV